MKVRGNAAHVAEKYMSLARDAQVSGDVVAAENYLQHAEHYNRIVMAAQSQFQQSQPQFREGGGDEGYDDDRQINGRGVRDRFAYNGEGRGDDEVDERIESESEGEDDRGFRQARDDRQRGPRDRYERHDRQDQRDNRDNRDRPERFQDQNEPQPEVPQPAEAAAPDQPPSQSRRRRGRPRGENAESAQEGEETSDGAAALAAFPE